MAYLHSNWLAATPRKRRLEYDALTSTGLLAKYTMEAGAGSTIKDRSGNGSPLDVNLVSGSNYQWISGQGIETINESSNAYFKSSSTAQKITNPIASSNQFTAEIYFRPALSAGQYFPARIMEVAKSTAADGSVIMIGQRGGSNNALSIRTQLKSSNGSNQSVLQDLDAGTIPGGQSNITRVYMCYSNNSLKVYAGVVGGSLSQVYSLNPGNNALSSVWGESFSHRLHFFNASGYDVDSNNNRQWFGEIYLAAFYNVDHRSLLGF